MKKIIITLLSCLYVCFAFAKDSVFYFRTSDQVNLYVRIAGTGQPCLFVHGGPGSTSYYFEAMPGAGMIEKKLKMVYFDQRGSGRSDSAINNDYSLQRMLKDMEELRASLGIKKWLVMGHSFGGILMTNYAGHYPAAVSGMMVIHGTLNMEASMKSHLEFGLKELGIADQAPYRDTSKALMERVGMIHNLLSEKDIWYRLMYRNAYEKKLNDSITLSAGKFNRDFASKVWGEAGYWKDFTTLSAAIKCPVLVMTGDRDYAIGVDHYKSFRFPKQTVVHYIGGHASFQEEPQWFAEKIIGFVEKKFK
ncbi:MAG: alpha/beta fold hydrolase [Flavisolibacter sp.]